ncbi:MAG: dihydroneopterin aldolase [Clostridiales bacterium]
MDNIMINGIRVFAYHGVLEEEQKLGQEFIIDIKMFLDLRKAGISDSISDTVDYSKVYKIVSDICISNKYKLLECLSNKIADRVLKEYINVDRIKIIVKKPNPPINGILDFVAIEIERKRYE